ncbi:CoA pyrophosphatase [Gammaproteobacteria bacterium]|jgi:8-oxo-dGTP pyrophosphatase MutT (NUDIX family)|nr:CoA pyrophosphatase [Gammaproteobacteria bacterium]MDC1251180.1 CoA pyrophosphatase [Gammaproteobacteria bacterium]|tara:strand:- start:757 stop:1335 length:579 start_codon:yes stop_codon:yes gene_type:complete
MLNNITEKIKSYSGTPPVEELRKAAVLIAITDSKDPELIYTLRSNKVGSHGGEVSFPGGMYEEEDNTLQNTALRESQEETGLDKAKVNILGPIDTVVSRFNVSVTPYVGIVPDDIELNDNSDEIEACFRVPLSFLLEDKRHRNDEINRNGDIFFMPAYQYDSYIIWGLTAMITVDFLNIALDAKIDLKTKGN